MLDGNTRARDETAIGCTLVLYKAALNLCPDLFSPLCHLPIAWE